MEKMVKMVSMKKMKKTALFMASAVMGAAIFSGCGGPGGAASATTAGADAGAAQATMPYNQVQETAAAIDEGFALTEGAAAEAADDGGYAYEQEKAVLGLSGQYDALYGSEEYQAEEYSYI